MNMQDKQIK